MHISLSRPLTLRTDQKDTFLAHLKEAIAEGHVKAVSVKVRDLTWYPNESKTRWFMVVRLQMSPDLSKLLGVSNGVAREFGQPLLYAHDESQHQTESEGVDQFHISIAWSLQAPNSQGPPEAKLFENEHLVETHGIPYSLLGQLSSCSIHFGEVKVRIGQDVHSIALKTRCLSSV